MLPSRRFILLLLPPAGMLLAGSVFGLLVLLALAYLLILAAYALTDAMLLPGPKQVRVRRAFPQRLSLGAATPVAYEVHNRSRRRVEVRLAEDLPPGVEVDGAAPVGIFEPGARGTLSCRLIASVRGRHGVRGLDVRVTPSPGLLLRQFRLAEPVELQVFPNLRNVGRYELLLRRGLLIEEGVARLRRVGQGSEFESLRPLVPGDGLSRVDWKATARRNELIVRQLQPERQQSVIAALDVGHATAAEYEGLSQLDHFVNAALMLAYVTLRHGDWFSLVAFSDRIDSYLPPVRGVGSIESVARALYELTPRLVAADYAGACRFLGLRNRKRSLICVMTDVVDRQASGILLAYLARFARRHLPLTVTLQDPDLHGFAARGLDARDDLFAKAVAQDVISARREALASLRHLGVGVLDCRPPDLTPALISRYLQIKAARRL